MKQTYIPDATEEMEQIGQLLVDGKSLTEIGKILGMNRQKVAKIRDEYNVLITKTFWGNIKSRRAENTNAKIRELQERCHSYEI